MTTEEVALVTEKFTNWRKSTRSSNSAGNCVEVAFADIRVGVRDSKTGGAGPVLEFRLSDGERSGTFG